MTSGTRRPGRPRAITRDMLAEAACELFLESGYDATSVTDIATRAGIGRSSFFNYAATKAELLWGGLDDRLDAAERAVDDGRAPDAALRAVAAGLAPDALALAITNAEAMRIERALAHEEALRSWRVSRFVARGLARQGTDALVAEVRAGSYGAALIAAITAWARSGAGAAPLAEHLERALDAVGR